MKKILFLCMDLNSGGAERVISTLANNLSKKYEVGIFMIQPKPKVKYDINKNVKLIKNNKSLYNFINIRKIIIDFKSDVLISFLAKTNIITSVALIGSQQNLIISERNDPYQNPSSFFIRKLRDFIYYHFDIKGFVFQTKDAQRYFPAVIQRKSRIIYNPLVDILPDYIEKKNFKRIVTVGRLDEQKNQKMLIEAFSLLENKEDLQLDIYGEGILRDELIAYTKILNLEDYVKFKGTTKNIFEEIKDAGVFAFSSNYEGMSNALIEALSLGIPTVSTNHPIGGAKELIKDGVNGYLVPIQDATSMSNKISYLLNHEDIAYRISKNALSTRRKLEVTSIVKEWENFIIKTLDNNNE